MGKSNGFMWGLLAGAAAVIGAAVLKRAVDEKKEKEVLKEKEDEWSDWEDDKKEKEVFIE